MNRKLVQVYFQYLFGNQAGVWVLIALHVFILLALILVFSSIISRMQDY